MKRNIKSDRINQMRSDIRGAVLTLKALEQVLGGTLGEGEYQYSFEFRFDDNLSSKQQAVSIAINNLAEEVRKLIKS